MRTRGTRAGKVSHTRGSIVSAPTHQIYAHGIDTSHIGKRLKEERKRLHRTQEEVAEAVELTPAFIGHIERGERSLSLDTLVKLCNYYGVTIDYLLADVLPANTDETVEQIQALLQGLSRERKAAVLDILNAVIRNL